MSRKSPHILGGIVADIDEQRSGALKSIIAILHMARISIVDRSRIRHSRTVMRKKDTATILAWLIRPQCPTSTFEKLDERW